MSFNVDTLKLIAIHLFWYLKDYCWSYVLCSAKYVSWCIIFYFWITLVQSWNVEAAFAVLEIVSIKMLMDLSCEGNPLYLSLSN